MITRPTTKVSILRGTSTNAEGDTVDANDPVANAGTRVDIPASIIEQGRRVYLPAEGATRVIRNTTCRLTWGTDVLKTDRVYDQTKQVVYNILELSDDPGSPAHRPDIVLQLSRTA